ncbi:MAG: Bacterial rane protein YfhO [Planctomycetota bacterium]|nr:Bacterial rane protein YfhO [Planctomycetota bacterium]
MRRLIGPMLGLGCVLALVLACFGQVLFSGEQFAYRDAGHFYYPLYQRVQQEWSKHRLPLWDSRENAGMPLLGNPTAAVLYPGKIIYSVLPYPWAARVYTIAHVAIALVGMYRLMRGWQTSREGSAFAAIAYAFGAPVLFQYCNIIYLVGAAWVPYAIGAVDGWLRTGQRSSLLILALALAMQMLGGDPQAAYVTGLCAGGYALGLTIARWRARVGRPPARGARSLISILGVIVAWTVAVLLCAWLLPGYRPKNLSGGPRPPLPLWPWVQLGVLTAWGAVASLCVMRRNRGSGTLLTMFVGLACAASLAAMMSAAQLLPVTEFTGQSDRAAQDGPHDIFPFSLEPVRLAELIWPEVYGSNRYGNHSWSSLLPPRHSMEVWVPSLYLGGLTLVLALSAFGLRGDGPRRVWLSWIATLGLLASLGEFGGPLWVARCVPAIANVIGEHDTADTQAIRKDGMLRDGDGSVYGLMATVVPGFGGFRYPSKLLTFVCLGVAGLSGIGLDRLLAGRSRKAVHLALGLAVVSASLLVAIQFNQPAFTAWLKTRLAGGGISAFGPFNPDGAWRESRNGLFHGTIVFACALAVLCSARHAPRFAGGAALALLTADLIVANAHLVITVPQPVFEGVPEVLRKIAEAEAEDPSPGPFRIHRMPYWDPYGWYLSGSPARSREMVEWERKTLQPKYGIVYDGVAYTMTEGVAELYDYRWFFSPFYGNRTQPDGPADDEKNPRRVYFPRRGFDIWNTRYFIVPAIDANDEKRSIGSFVLDTEPISPRKEQLEGEQGKRFFDRWSKAEDWRLVKNKNVFPRAWIVHNAEFRQPISGIGRQGRESMIQEMLYQNDRLWTMPRLQVQDLREKAYIEMEGGAELNRFLSHSARDEEETASVEVDDQRVVIDVEMKSNGIVVLADVFYPGWELTVDDEPATILRTNRMMRGAAVEAGVHRLVYRYRPQSVRVGMMISFWGVGLLIILVIAFRSRRFSPTLSSSW